MSEMQGFRQVKSLEYRFVRIQRSSKTIWWPCVLFPSQDELQQSLSNQTTKNAVVILFATTCRVGDVLPVAYLLGDHPPVVARFITSEDEELLDFYTHFAKMGQKYKYDAKWCNAREAVMSLLASDDPTNLGQSAFLDDVPSSPAYSIDTPSPENKKRSVAYEDVTTAPGTTVATMSSPTSRQKAKTMTLSRNTVEPMSSPESRVFNVEFVESASSPESSASRSLKFAKARLSIKLNATDDWITAKDKLRKMGWRILTGKGMVKHYYVDYSLRKVESYKGLLETYPDEEGKLWFTSEDSWKNRIKDRYHWEERAQQNEEQKKEEVKERTSNQARYLGPYPKNGDSWPGVMNLLNAMGYDWLRSCSIFASRRLINLNVSKGDLIKHHLDVKGTEWFEEEEDIKEYVTSKYNWNTSTDLGASSKRAGRGVYDREKVKGQGRQEEKDQSKGDQQSIRTSRSTRNLANPLQGDSWAVAMDKLKALGYCWLKTGNTFVTPRLSKMDVTKGVLKKEHMDLKGVEWFENEDEIKNYTKKKYKWNAGVSPDNSSKPGFQGMYDRTKSRRRTIKKTPFTKTSVKKQPPKKRGHTTKKTSPSVISFPKKVGLLTKKRGHEEIEESPSVNSSLSSDSADELVQDGSESEDNIDTQVLVQNMPLLRSSPRKSPQSSVSVDTSSTSTKYMNQLPTFKTVWPILSKHFGFRMVNREKCLFCLPGVDPDAVEVMLGRDYFDEELDFRKHLCAYGLPKPTAELLDEDKDVLEKWVKYAIVSQLRSASNVRMVEPLDGMKAWSLLKKIGFRYGGGRYILPGVQMKPKGATSLTKPVKGKDFFEKMEGDDGYWRFLARFGIESFHVKSLNETERLQLELFLAACPTVYCFEQIEPSEGDPIFVMKSLGGNSTPIDLTSPSKESPSIASGEGYDGSSQRKAKNTEVLSNQKELVNENNEQELSAFPVSDTAAFDCEKSPTQPISPKVGKEFVGEHMMEYNNTIENAQEQNNPAGLPYLTQPETTLEDDDYNELTEDIKKFDEIDLAKIAAQEVGFTSPPKTAMEDKCEESRNSRYLATATGVNDAPLESSQHSPEKKAKKKLKLDMSPVQEKDDWRVVQQKMMDKDWTYKRGQGIVSWYYVRTSNGKEEKYDEYGMQKFAFDHLGWGGNETFLAVKNDLESNIGTKRQRRHAASVSSVSILERVNRKENDTETISSKQTSDETKTQAPEATSSTQSAKRARTEVAPESSMSAPILTFPETQSTVREKLVCCQQVLHPNHACESLAMLDNNDATTRAPYVKQIQNFLNNIVSTSGEYGEKPSIGETGKSPTLYVCGRTGTGKTTAVQNCCNEIIKERKSQKGSNQESVPIVCYINVAHIFKANDVTSQSRNEILGKIGTALEMKTDSINTTQIDKKMKNMDGSNKVKPVLILIFDEIDLIVTKTNRDTQELLDHLLSWASSPSYCCALIGISNEIQLRRFKALEKIAQQITFPTFKKAELTEIITERVGISIIDPQAVKFVATTVERNCGDARKAMGVISDAVGKCMNSLSDEELLVVGMTQGPIVKMCHVREAIKESNLPLNEKITNLPHAAKVVLCVAMELSKVSAYHDSIPIGLLKRMCNEASRQELFEDLAMEHFADLIQRLDDAGLLLSCIPGSSIIQQMVNKDNLYDVRISIGVQLEEVECALESTLLQNSFFARMKKHVESKYDS